MSKQSLQHHPSPPPQLCSAASGHTSTPPPHLALTQHTNPALCSQRPTTKQNRAHLGQLRRRNSVAQAPAQHRAGEIHDAPRAALPRVQLQLKPLRLPRATAGRCCRARQQAQRGQRRCGVGARCGAGLPLADEVVERVEGLRADWGATPGNEMDTARAGGAWPADGRSAEGPRSASKQA